MEGLQTLLDNNATPLLTAFVLGLLTTLSPCPLATNVVAIGYIGRDIESRQHVFRNGLLYTLGRVVAYTLLGVVLIALLKGGSSLFGVQKFVGKYGEMLIGPLLLLMGVFMLWGERWNFASFGYKGKGETFARKKGWGAFLLGVLLALAFCPTSGMFYFGMLIPLSTTVQMGYFLPVVFAIATALPVLLVAWVLAFSAGEIGRVYGMLQTIRRWVNFLVGVLFLGVGVYYCVMIYVIV